MSSFHGAHDHIFIQHLPKVQLKAVSFLKKKVYYVKDYNSVMCGVVTYVVIIMDGL